MPRRILLLLALAPLAYFAAEAPGPAEAPRPGDLPQVLAGGETAPGPRIVRAGTRPAAAPEAAPVAGRATVIDGDSLRLAGEEIRLHGIDAPEARQRCATADGRAYACGREATQALTRLVREGRTTCTGADRDRYGRLLAVCETGGTQLNRAMVAAGWALAFRRYAATYVAVELQARATGRGLWAGDFVEPWDWRDGRRLAASPQAARATPATPAQGCRIKGNISGNGRIYHSPGSRHYARTRIDPARGERWFCSTDEAVRAGWRAPRG